MVGVWAWLAGIAKRKDSIVWFMLVVGGGKDVALCWGLQIDLWRNLQKSF